MKVVSVPKYGSPDGLEIREVPIPDPSSGEVLVKLSAASVNAGDWHIVRGTPWIIRLMFGVNKPKITALGSDMAGIVETVGDGVTKFVPGDAVFASLPNFGAFAEYALVSSDALVKKPTGLSFEEAAAIPLSGVTALQGLRDVGKITKDDRVLIIGASGGVGSFAVQIAKAFGARVTAVCSTTKIQMVQSLGADEVVDYKVEDVTLRRNEFDLVLDAGAFRSIFDYSGCLSKTGRYVLVGGSNAQFFQAMLLGPLRSKKTGQRFGTMTMKSNPEDLAFLTGLVDAGKLRSIVGQRFSLTDAAAAVRCLENGCSTGKVIITIAKS